MPVPVKLTVCGLPAALSLIESDAVRNPSARGSKTRPSVQLPPAAIVLLTQLCVTKKSCQSVPAIVGLEMFKGALPMFERVTVCVELPDPKFTWPNERLPGVRLTTGAGGGGGLTPPPPPPQAAQTPSTSSAVANSQIARRRPLKANLMDVARAKDAHSSHGHRWGGGKLGWSFGCTARVVALEFPVVV